MTNLYQVMGLPPTASQESIKAVYRELSRCWHPDRPGGDETKFRAIAAAYQVLSQPESRSRWDVRRAQWLAKRDAVDCPRCGTPNRLRLHGVAMKCGRCRAPLPSTMPTGRILIADPLHLYNRADSAEGVVLAVIDRDALLGVDLSRALRVWLRMLLAEEA